MRRFALILLFLPLVAALPALGGEDLVDCSLGERRWSSSEPQVNLTHLFCGEYKEKRRKLTGYHAFGGARSPGEAYIAAAVKPRNERGIYWARVCRSEAAKVCKGSTMFPDHWSHSLVVEEILSAYHSSKKTKKWRGLSKSGLIIEGWLLDDGRINTAWPLYDAL